MRRDDFSVSIIITSYNRRDFLVAALESVIAQTLRPCEIIVADDASSDGSQEVLRSYVRRYPGWVQAIFQERNQGIPRNRNTALRQVRGNYVGILDGDDLFLPDKLERQYGALCAVPGARAVYGNFETVNPRGARLHVRYDSPQPEGYIFPAVATFNFGILRTLVAESEAVRAAGLMEERYRLYDGFWLSVKLASFCRFAYVDQPLVRKRSHPHSDSRRRSAGEFLFELSGMYRELQTLLASVAPPIARYVNASWQTELARLADEARRESVQPNAGPA
jgi:glycosyltransferase involved in cell wall biosynthesis